MEVGGRFDVGARESGHLAGDRCSDNAGTGRNCVVAKAIADGGSIAAWKALVRPRRLSRLLSRRYGRDDGPYYLVWRADQPELQQAGSGGPLRVSIVLVHPLAD